MNETKQQGGLGGIHQYHKIPSMEATHEEEDEE